MIKKFLASEEDTLAFGRELAQTIDLGSGLILYLQGPLGAGKTTFMRGFLNGLGFLGRVKSPTYALVEPYQIAEQSIFHFDFYRIEKPEELRHLGFEEYFLVSAICVIEWPDKAGSFLPMPDLICTLSYHRSGRSLKIKSLTAKGRAILKI